MSSKSNTATCDGAARAMAQDDPTGPQPTLPQEPLTITDDNGKPHAFKVEMATTPQDTIEDFRNVYDFTKAFESGYRVPVKS